MARTEHRHEDVIRTLAGRPCRNCKLGSLERGHHEGAPAAVCDNCEVPQIRFH